MPESKLSQFFLMKELKFLSTGSWRQGRIWTCEKLRTGAEVCPRCATPSTCRYGVAYTNVRDEVVRGQPILLRIRKHRYLCKVCRKPFTEAVPGILPRRRTTQRLRKQMLLDCEQFTNLSQVAHRHYFSKSFVHRLFYEQMELRLRERVGQRWPQVVGIDEHFFSRSKGFTEFTTVFTDIGRRKMFEMAESKNKSSLLEQVGQIEGRQNVTLAVMDLSRGYHALAKELFPNARIVADKFHVLRLLTPALIRVRRQIHGHRQELHLRRKLLMNRGRLEYFQRCEVDRYLNQHPELKELYHFKERLHQLYRTKGYVRAGQALQNLLLEMERSTQPDVVRLRATLKAWSPEILEYFRSRFTNAFTEAMNGIAKLVQRRGCGYRNFKNYRLRTLNACPL
ncbi:MAG: ISL3 family transposase [Bdellovibrionaceae bacterium]|nr:ISL3 family transposase [Pseudobdellovibrionaceae bacterium]